MPPKTFTGLTGLPRLPGKIDAITDRNASELGLVIS